MPRYDHDRGRPGPWGPSGRDFGPGGWNAGDGYGGDFRPQPRGMDAQRGPQGGGPWDEMDGEWSSGPVYGPARYGLGPYHQRLRSRRRPDDEVRKEVEDALFYDTWVDAEAITVEVADGVVTLRGELPDYHEIRYATDDAWDVDGVRGVHCQLTVNGTRRPPVDGVPRRTAQAGNSVGNG
ncbi:BON domain-containing protein [Longimicrobium sp.]|uniref:BON domain-containing protein n=1 Tax=Longimicrobium sp. TaxID=2029185 RepID=UPI002E3783F6|nr:BON domain-containing protein [Longimicrobium sp.]HEX6037411.1 BON domain-containing protein [Longimicrobium sp.]